MRFFPLAGLFLSSLTLAGATPQEQYLSSVEVAVHESSPLLLRRSQQLILDQFTQTFNTLPEFAGQSYEMRTNGNEVVLFLTTNKDMREPMQEAVANMIGTLNGRVRARGRSVFYKAELTKPIGGYLEVTVDDTHSKIMSVAAQSVTFRDLLKEIKNQVGSISYLIPGECADQLVDWSFGEMGDAEPKTIEAALGELATLFNLKFEKRSGTYIFSGTCNALKRERTRAPVELLRSNFLPPSLREEGPWNGIQGARVHQVFLPVFPFAE